MLQGNGGGKLTAEVIWKDFQTCGSGWCKVLMGLALALIETSLTSRRRVTNGRHPAVSAALYRGANL